MTISEEQPQREAEDRFCKICHFYITIVDVPIQLSDGNFVHETCLELYNTMVAWKKKQGIHQPWWSR